MDAQQLQSILVLGLERASLGTPDWDDAPELLNTTIHTFEEDGVLTHDKGLTLSLEDGSEFQLTIVQTLFPTDFDDPAEEEA